MAHTHGGDYTGRARPFEDQGEKAAPLRPQNWAIYMLTWRLGANGGRV